MIAVSLSLRLCKAVDNIIQQQLSLLPYPEEDVLHSLQHGSLPRGRLSLLVRVTILLTIINSEIGLWITDGLVSPKWPFFFLLSKVCNLCRIYLIGITMITISIHFHSLLGLLYIVDSFFNVSITGLYLHSN